MRAEGERRIRSFSPSRPQPSTLAHWNARRRRQIGSRRGHAQRQIHRERRALAIPALDGDRTSEPLEELARDAQAKAGSTKLARSRLIDLSEVFPDRLEVRLPNADARVDDIDAHTAWCALRFDSDAAVIRELHRV